MFRVRRVTILTGLLVGICLVVPAAVSFATPAAFETTDPIVPVYAREGGPEGWLGLPISPMMYPQYLDKNRDPEHWRQDFEGGYISWSYTTGRYEAMPYFVRIEGDPRVYLVSYGRRRWIPEDNTLEEFAHWRGLDSAWQHVKVLASPDIYPLDKALDHLVRQSGDPEVLYVPRGSTMLRSVESPVVMDNWDLFWGHIIPISADDMAARYTRGRTFHRGMGFEARPKIEALSYPKVVWAGRDIRVRWQLTDWFSDTDTELHYRVDDGTPQKIATQHGGNKRYRAKIPASVVAGGQTVEIWIRAAERGKSNTSDDDRLEFWEPDVDAGFAPFVITVKGKQG